MQFDLPYLLDEADLPPIQGHQRAGIKPGWLAPKGIMNLYGHSGMSEQELLIVIRMGGRFEVVSEGNGLYFCSLIPADALLIHPESDRECREFFRNTDD